MRILIHNNGNQTMRVLLQQLNKGRSISLARRHAHPGFQPSFFSILSQQRHPQSIIMTTRFSVDALLYRSEVSMIDTTLRRCMSSKSDSNDKDPSKKHPLEQENKDDINVDDEPRRPDEPILHFVSNEEQRAEDATRKLKDVAAGETVIDKSLFTEVVKVRMPDMGEGDGKILEWYKQEGDLIRRDEALCLIETEDFSFDMIIEDESDAIVGEILVPAGSAARDEQVICILLHPKPPTADKDGASDTSSSKQTDKPPAAETKP